MSSEVILMRKVESSETKAVQSGQNSYQSCLGGGSNYNKKVLELGYSKRTSTYAPAFAILLLQFAIHVHYMLSKSPGEFFIVFLHYPSQSSKTEPLLKLTKVGSTQIY